MADSTGGRRLDIKFDHPSPIWKYIKDGDDLPDEMIINSAREHPVGKLMLDIIGLKSNYSIMMMRQEMDREEVGVLNFGAKGRDRYTEEDLHLIRLLRTPFAIALSNSRRYHELLELKNLLADDNRYLQNELLLQKSHEIVGADFGLSRVMQLVHQVAPLSSPVLLTGETGVGKEVIANAIHNFSTRKDGPFIKVNCGAIPETLIDSELFGHEKGAFTGAIEKRRGRFERAHKGTIFLDEIGELPAAAQLRLLRVLQEMEFEPVGASKSVKVDIRVIAATNRNLGVLIKEGHFRQDLYFRLNVFPIHIPPLRERKCDIPALVQHLILKKYRKMGFQNYPALANGALKSLNAYDWPGNVRELENAVEKAMIIGSGQPLRFDDISTSKSLMVGIPPDLSNGEDLLLDDVTSHHIKRVLDLTKGKVSGPGGAAELLGLNPATLRHKMRKLGIAFGRGVY
jgi:transcriptional regulator with GAF, ATPase, and Fis domain